MLRPSSSLGLVCATLAFTACAHTSFYSDPELKQETGFRYYTAKPYVLVSHTGATEKPTEVSIVYLPDMEHPQFAVSKAGWGSSEFSISVSNGIATEVGQKMNSMGPETLAALGGIATSIGDLAKALAEAARTRRATEGTEPLQPETPAPTFELYEVRLKNGKTTLVRVDVEAVGLPVTR
jgi:hypothetical protein